jgi:hypothetical protein
MASRALGAGSGGTFTNLVPWEEGEARTHKRPGTPEDSKLPIVTSARASRCFRGREEAP